MSNPYEGQDPLVIAQQAERDLNSYDAKRGTNKSLSGNVASSHLLAKTSTNNRSRNRVWR